MITQSVLAKMRTGVTVAGVALALNGAIHAEDAVKPKVAEVCEIKPLTAEQLAEFNKLLPDLGSKDPKVDQAAYNGILKLGKGALDLLKKAEKEAKDENVKYRINYLIQYIASDGKYCPPCGMG
jgi:MoaA/NifB/PqqE/SkfB family radical SAM enzyme